MTDTILAADRVMTAIYLSFTGWTWAFVATFEAGVAVLPGMALTGVTLGHIWNYRKTDYNGPVAVLGRKGGEEND